MKLKHAMQALFVVVFCATGLLAQVGGSGTTHRIPIWTGSTTLGNSRIFQKPTRFMGIGTTNPTADLHILTNLSGSDTLLKVENTGPFSAATLELKAASTDNLNDWLIEGADTGSGNTEGFRLRNATTGVVAMEVAPNLNVGIGTQSPTTKLHVAGGDMQTSDPGAGLIAKSPDGTICARIGIDNFGAIMTTPVSCP